MKRTLLLFVVLAPVALAGCQTIKAHNPFRHKAPDYQSAQQEQPLEVPPGMDQPATSEALVIPGAGQAPATTAPGAAAPPAIDQAPATPAPGAATPPATGQAAATAAAGATASSLTLQDTPDSAYHRVGLALARGDVGQVIGKDDAAHSYQVAVNSVVTKKDEGGFFHRLFHRDTSEMVTGTVTVGITAQGSGSVVQASGNPSAVERVMSVLKQRLGGG